MKKIITGILFTFFALSFAKYNYGDVCQNLSWTDNNGLATSIYEQTASGKAVVLFWGNKG